LGLNWDLQKSGASFTLEAVTKPDNEEKQAMKHLKVISLPRKATVITDEPTDGGETGGGDGVVEILDTVFGFVLELVGIKGKGTAA